ncbi:MAG: SUMF1/EgtB/PvdO family nonheme iron enzyme [Chlamydiales bacterium]|nr:formylglycine-generating enzyme family protein [Chlamydiales bacterium]NCF70355.1 SUMF1/EgtB/PvdO family nonheme iron enzyme [Chlamydiales bacterium]
MRLWNRKILSFFLSLLILSTLSAAPKDSEDADLFTVKLTKDEWIKIGNQLKLNQDIVLLRDGTRLIGTIEEIPSIQYFFGTVDFSPTEVSAIVFAPYFNDPKMQIVTWRGENYIGKMPEATIKFYESKSSTHNKGPSFNYVEISPAQIDTIVLKKRGKTPPLLHSRVMSLVLHNGDRFPFVSDAYKISVEDGSGSFSLNVEDIVDIRNHGGIEGYVKSSGLDRKLVFTTVLDQSFPIQLAKDGQKLQVPWVEIARVMGDRGEFILKSPYLFQLKRIEDMVYVPPGKFYFGTNVNAFKNIEGVPTLLSKKHLSPYTVAQLLFNAEEQDFIESPPVLVEMPGFYIDKYEVTNKQYRAFVEATGVTPPRHWENGTYLEGTGDHPVVNVTFSEAKAYAKWVGKSLPSEIEWERAAKGASGFPYSYGGEFKEGLSNVMGDNTLPVGSYEDLMYSQKYNPELFQKEVQDMSGNVQEWTDSPYEYSWLKELYASNKPLFNPRNLAGHPLKVVKGGSFKSSAKTSTTTFRSPMHEEDLNEFTGFRCIIYDKDLPFMR